MTHTTRIRRVALALAAVALLVAGSAGARAQAKLDITGTWLFDVVTDQGGGTPTITLKLEGEKVTGHISSMTFGEQDLTGTLKGRALEFKFGAADAGDVTYKGTVESSDAIKGTMEALGAGLTGTFTAKRK
jgi:hypothetical protein